MIETRVLAVLMWKHGVVRIRKFVHTALDFVLPVVLFVLLFAFKDELNPLPPSSKSQGVIQNTEVIPLYNDNLIRINRLIYYPESPLTDSLIKKAASKLKLKPLDTYPHVISRQQGYYGCSNYTELASFAKEMSTNDAIIIFQDMEQDTLPDKLNYTIRMRKHFATNTYELPDGNYGRRSMFGHDYEVFMSVQWAIDTSYIKLQSGNEVKQEVYYQEFPFYEKATNIVLGIIGGALPATCWLSLLLTFVFLMCRLLEERTSGIQELIKMVGVSLKTLALSHFLNVLPIGLVFSVVVTILLKVTDNPIFPNSNPVILFLMLILYYNTVVALAFVCSYINKTAEYAVTMSVIIYGVLWAPVNVLNEVTLPLGIQVITGILPHVPMVWFWKQLVMLEIYDTGVTVTNMFTSNHKQACSVFVSLLFLVIQIVVYYALAWYLSLVRPGKFGQALPWDFVFKRQFWCKNEVRPDTPSGCDSEELMSHDMQYFERPPENINVGIKVDNVTKVYPKHTALKDVSLKAYKGEITVLLGHNGAGKTTLMSIITGMTSATTGNVYVNGLDTVKDQAEVRKHIGLCPQQNMFFPDLTLHEHIMFFTMLKRGTYAEAKSSSSALAARLELHDKLSDMCAALSGGMKRRAQLACALAGDADILVLDEPTSGLDVETRRELWNLLLSLRGERAHERTVLLSTHFMEEADALGDRVAALHSGQLRCFATTMHLKKAIGNGYRLSLTTLGKPKETAITPEVVKFVPGATIKDQTINNITYNLPATSNDQFPELFTTLESLKPQLGITSIGLGVSTLEEVFLKLCSDVDTTVLELTNGVDNSIPEPLPKRLTGPLLYWRQIIVLLKRQIRFTLYKKWIFLIWQIFIPILIIFTTTNNMNNSNAGYKPPRSLHMNLDIYSDMRDRRALYDIRTSDVLRTDDYPGVTFEKADDVAKTILDICIKDVLQYNRYLVGVELNNTNAKMLYSTTVRHAAPVALNMLSNVLSGGRINTYNHPIEGALKTTEVEKQPKEYILVLVWVIIITFLIQATSLHCVSLACRERASGARHIHVMSGCPPELHWSVTLLFHITLTSTCLILPTVIAAAIMDQDMTINQPGFLFTFALILVAGSLALKAFMYLVSFYVSERNTSIILVIYLFLFGLICPIVKLVADFAKETLGKTDDRSALNIILSVFSYVTSPHAMTSAATRSATVAEFNAMCSLARHHCPVLPFVHDSNWKDEDTRKCCNNEDPRCYFCLDGRSPVGDIVVMFVQFLVLMIFVFLTERGVFNGLFDRIRNFRYSPEHQDSKSDDMVNDERAYVDKQIANKPEYIKDDSLLVSDIHKNYPSILPWKKSCNAVKGVSFSVKKGECFGLLGVNGAGKSTTFKMLTAEECVTKGKIYGNGYHLTSGNSQYLQTLGYCPQFFGLDMFQTGEENLELVLTLRGFDQQQVRKEIDTWIEIVGLEKYARRHVESYSGGCVRRLGAASALCGGAELTLLDEPSAGVDVAARRRLWDALRRALRQDRAIVITSHSMDEMETLCSRIAILCAGRIRALGAPAALRAAHAAGHALVIKVKYAPATDETDGTNTAPTLSDLKAELIKKFNCILKDEHKTMLHYHINQTMRYSELFAALESLKQLFGQLIEDYSVTETTLEEVFLSLAKETKQLSAAEYV